MHRDPNAVIADTRKRETLVSMLDQLCQQLDLTESQYETARSRYESIGEWLAGGSAEFLQSAVIYAHGSIGLGTANKPIGRNEFDVDLMCHLPGIGPAATATAVKALVGKRLREHAKYAAMLEEKPRCWRINYANEFHLDITPSIVNPRCAMGGELVPDKKLLFWKATNPEGYKCRFESYAKLGPRFYIREAMALDMAYKADIEPFPEQTMSKPLLKRIVQILKRHRDHAFSSPSRQAFAPISIIITTLAAWSYADCVKKRVYADVFELIVDVIARMPDFIKIEENNGRKIYTVENETTVGENFAEKWNQDERLSAAFYSWQKNALTSITSLLTIDGLDAIGRHLGESFGVGQEQVKKAVDPVANAITAARSAGTLRIAPSVGIVAAPAHGGVVVRPNTFFGR